MGSERISGEISGGGPRGLPEKVLGIIPVAIILELLLEEFLEETLEEFVK